MTVKEAAQLHKFSEYTASSGDNINRVCWNIYKNLNPLLKQAIVRLNPRTDWDFISPGAVINYYEQDIMLSISWA